MMLASRGGRASPSSPVLAGSEYVPPSQQVSSRPGTHCTSPTVLAEARHQFIRPAAYQQSH